LAAAGPNDAKHFQNLPITSSKKPQILPNSFPNAPKTVPKPSQSDPESIQKASWSSSWTNAFQKHDLERPKNGQNAPKSGQKTPQSVPTPSQIEPKTLQNQIFKQFFCLFFSDRKFASFFCSFATNFACFLKSRPSKFMRPRSVLLASTRFRFFRKNYQKSSENRPKILPKSIQNL